MERYIVNGGSCTGKTSVLKELEKRGMSCVPETARPIIAEEKEKAKTSPDYRPVLPWTDLRKFEERVIERQLSLERMIQDEIAFLDRSLVDPIAYLEQEDLSCPPGLHESIKNASYTRVFFMEQLPFYIRDEERTETAEEAAALHKRLYETYDRLGFDIITIPAVGIEERVDMILGHLGIPEEEIEEKFFTPHQKVRQAMGNYHLEYQYTKKEENRIYDLFGICRNRGYTIRLRNDGSYLFTFKGKDKGTNGVKKKLEWELELPGFLYHALSLLPEKIFYPKIRETYIPLGDKNCKVTLDTIPGLGEFVEVEAKSENQVKLWEKRLGLENPIKESYPELMERFGSQQ